MQQRVAVSGLSICVETKSPERRWDARGRTTRRLFTVFELLRETHHDGGAVLAARCHANVIQVPGVDSDDVLTPDAELAQ